MSGGGGGARLSPRALAIAGFGVVPWLMGLLLAPVAPGQVSTAAESASTAAFVAVELVGLLSLALVVRDRIPVRWPRLALGGASLTLLSAVARFVVVPLLLAPVPTTSLDEDPGFERVFVGYGVAAAAFMVGCVLMAFVCLPALWSHWRRGRDG